MLRLLCCFAFSLQCLLGAYPFEFSETLVATTISSPTAMAFAPDGRLFVCEQTGAVRVIKNGALLPTPFTSIAVDQNGERGLLGITVDPNFATNGFVYVYYTPQTGPKRDRVTRFTASGDVAVPGSEQVILDLDFLSTATIHNGGALHFGADGKLYVAVGDNANGANSQSFESRLGKILRVNPDGSIPSDNPFLGRTTGANQAIWAMGLRNPYTLGIHPTTGRIHINDVGQDTVEEINEGIPGANYGWPNFEGGDGGNPNFTDPIASYNHTGGAPTGCAITGGAFYTGSRYPQSFANAYFFADFCAQFIYYLPAPAYNTLTPFGTGLGRSAVDLKVFDGELYYLTRDNGSVYRITFAGGGTRPSITQHPAGRSVAAGQTATFTVSASGSTPLSYTWQRNGLAIPGAPNSATYTTPAVTAADNGARFRVVVSNSLDSVTSNEAVLTVQAGNTAPVPTIDTPAAGTLFQFGDSISFSGSATDAEDGNLPASAFTWRVDFHHDAHVHPQMPSTSGSKTGTFQANYPETSANIFYRITLTVTDSRGAQTTVTRDILPRPFTASNGLGFVAITPCRLLDTRASEGFTGVFGPPALAAGVARDVPLPAGRCNIPPTAKAFSLNVTVLPKTLLSFLSLWPTGQPQPNVSTLNSFHGGVVANAAIVPAGINGGVTVLATHDTEAIIDINGYFLDGGALRFYSLDPCRVADTRGGPGFPGLFGLPVQSGTTTRDFPIPSSPCLAPVGTAYSLNVTVVPREPLAFLTIWPAGSPRPLVSTLNSFDRAVVANAAVVPADRNGLVSTFVTNTTDVILDINGYFGDPGRANELFFYPVSPCRAVDTRVAGQGSPVLSRGATRDFQIAGRCGVPADAKALSLNATVVPTSALSYLTLWPAGKTQPVVSTLNSFLGRVVANAAIVPTGANATVSAFVTDDTHLILDVNGYFR